MPPKRKASEHTRQTPSKRQALVRANKQNNDDPAPGMQSPEHATSTPKVRRTYGKQPTASKAVIETINLEAAIPPPPTSNQNLNAQQILLPPDGSTPAPSPTKPRGRRRRLDTDETPTKRQSKRHKAHQETEDLHDSEQRGRADQKAKPIVEIPVLSSPRNATGATKISSPTYPEPYTPQKLTFPAIPSSHTPQKRPATYGRSPDKAHGLPNGKHLDYDLSSCLNAQKRAILRTMQNPTRLFNSGDLVDTDKSAKEQLQDLLNGTVLRSEGNSCLVFGSRASGKSKVVESCLRSLPSPNPPIVIQLSGLIHHTDRLAMREIAYQLSQQTGKSFVQAEETEPGDLLDQDDEDPFRPTESQLALPPSAHLPALISTIPTLSRPTIVILDAFDMFTLHPRQALLYCLLDTVQSCRASADNKGFAVIGLTTRIDTINLLEKRVKSRFSGRVIRCSGIPDLKHWLELTREILCADVSSESVASGSLDEWNHAWKKQTSEFLQDSTVVEMIKDTVGIAKDPKLLFRILTSTVIRLSPTAPFLTPSSLSQAICTQRSRSLYDGFEFPYPALCLIIAATHSRTAGHEVFTFEMLFNTFRNQLRASVAAPVQVNGGSIGMVRCSKAILESAFEHLIACRVFVPAGALSNIMAKEFVRYRITLEWDEVKRIVDKTGQVTLKKWFNKAE